MIVNIKNEYIKLFLFISILLARSSTINNSPMHTIISHTNEEDELEREIEHLERRLVMAKSQLIQVTFNKKPKQIISQNER